MSNNIEKLPGVIVEDITELVNSYCVRLNVHPITHTKYVPDHIAAILVNHPGEMWEDDTNGQVLFMETLLLKDIITDMRLDAIQHINALKDIINICESDRPFHSFSNMAQICRDAGV